MATSTTKTTTKAVVETKPAVESKSTSNSSSDNSVNNIEKTVQDHTPNFVSKIIISTIDNLEYFRTNYFNDQVVFYPILAIFVFFVGRYLWRKFF